MVVYWLVIRQVYTVFEEKTACWSRKIYAIVPGNDVVRALLPNLFVKLIEPLFQIQAACPNGTPGWE